MTFDFGSAINSLFTFLRNILGWTLDGILLVIGEALYLPFDGLLTFISSMITAINFSSFASTYALNWAGLPPQMIWFINSIGIPQGITCLLAAVAIRMGLNLIPSWATRI